jgi:phosphosulfolactate synthase (CoM biosynthesis protein A)
MTEIDNDEPNKLLDCQIRVFEVEQDHLGLLDLEIDEGFISLVIDRKTAAVLISELAIFMAAEEVDEVDPEPSEATGAES